LLVTPEAYPRRKHLKGPPIGLALALSSNSKTRLKRFSNGTPSSLLGLVIGDEGKKFYNIDTWVTAPTSASTTSRQPCATAAKCRRRCRLPELEPRSKTVLEKKIKTFDQGVIHAGEYEYD